jgi:DNA invertase Pin-like site-specific DNA recombinase
LGLENFEKRHMHQNRSLSVSNFKRIHRLARSNPGPAEHSARGSRAGATFKSLADPWVDTSSPIGEFMLTVLGGVAALERHLIKARRDVGIKRAREAGIKFGRRSKLVKHQQQQAIKLLSDGEPQSAVARLLAVDQSTNRECNLSQRHQRGCQISFMSAIRTARHFSEWNQFAFTAPPLIVLQMAQARLILVLLLLR